MVLNQDFKAFLRSLNNHQVYCLPQFPNLRKLFIAKAIPFEHSEAKPGDEVFLGVKEI
jgi:hypothetical protein